MVTARTIGFGLLAALASLAVFLVSPGAALAQTPYDSDAMYGGWMLLPGETLVINIEEAADYQYVASNCASMAQMRVNGGQMYGGVVSFSGTSVTIVNGTARSCWVEIRGRMNRCVGAGCDDNSNHWAVRNRGMSSGAGAVGFAREVDNIFSNEIVVLVMTIIVASIVGSGVVEMFRRIAGGEDEEDLDYSDIDSDDDYR